MSIARSRSLRVGAALALVLAAAPAGAQQRLPSIDLAPYAGYMIFGDIARGPLGTSVSNANGSVLGAQLGLRLAPGVTLVGNVARASTDLQIGAPFLGSVSVGGDAMWMFDGGLQLGMPLAGGLLPVSPFLQVGAGAVRHEVESMGLKSNATNFAWNVGAGLDLALAPNLGLRLMAKDYVGKFDIREATGFDVDAAETMHNVALSAGLRLSF